MPGREEGVVEGKGREGRQCPGIGPVRIVHFYVLGLTGKGNGWGRYTGGTGQRSDTGQNVS